MFTGRPVCDMSRFGGLPSPFAFSFLCLPFESFCYALLYSFFWVCFFRPFHVLKARENNSRESYLVIRSPNQNQNKNNQKITNFSFFGDVFVFVCSVLPTWRPSQAQGHNKSWSYVWEEQDISFQPYLFPNVGILPNYFLPCDPLLLCYLPRSLPFFLVAFSCFSFTVLSNLSNLWWFEKQRTAVGLKRKPLSFFSILTKKNLNRNENQKVKITFQQKKRARVTQREREGFLP